MKASPRFELGKTVVTPGIIQTVPFTTVLKAITLHAGGNWGIIGDEDATSNERAIEEGTRIFSAYASPPSPDGKIWVITEADRSVTTVLLPSEY